MNEDFYDRAANIRTEYKRLVKAAAYATTERQRNTLKVAARATAYRMNLLLKDNGYNPSTEEVLDYLK